MITKDEITMYICSYALFLKEMLMFRYIVAHMNATGNEQFWDTFPWQDFFPDISLTILTVNNIPDISLTCLKFPDISRFSRLVPGPKCKSERKLTFTTWHIQLVTSAHLYGLRQSLDTLIEQSLHVLNSQQLVLKVFRVILFSPIRVMLLPIADVIVMVYIFLIFHLIIRLRARLRIHIWWLTRHLLRHGTLKHK